MAPGNLHPYCRTSPSTQKQNPCEIDNWELIWAICLSPHSERILSASHARRCFTVVDLVVDWYLKLSQWMTSTITFRSFQWALRIIGSCTSSVRVNTRGLSGDCHKSKKTWTRGPSGLPGGPLILGDALDAGHANARRLLRPPHRAVSHHPAGSYPHWLGPRRHAEE